MNVITQVLTSSIVSSMFAVGVVWLFRTWISERLKSAIKHEYDEKLETHKAQLKAQTDIETERLRSQLNIAAHERQVRFADLHTKRAEVIAELYGLIVQAYWDTSSFVSPADWNGEPDKKQKYVTAMNAIADFFRFFDKNRIYLPEALCEQLESFVQKMRSEAIGFGVYVRYNDDALPSHALEKKHDAWTKAWEYFGKEIPMARAALEAELREILGGN